MTIRAISLFSSGGIGDLALKNNNIDILVANELIKDRAQVFMKNYPETKMIIGDINTEKDNIIKTTKQILKGRPLDVLYATPPCQGMSKNGRGKLLQGIRNGKKPVVDIRNKLIIPTIEITKKLNPETLILENVPEMENTLIDVDGNMVNIIDYIKLSLPNYTGRCEVVEFANYGVPEKRQRLITIFTRNKKLQAHFSKNNTFLPPQTHAEHPTLLSKKWITLRETIFNLPPLDAKNKITATSDIPFHRVPILDKDKYFWVSNTPAECGAFDNQCIHCGCQNNPTHKSKKNVLGINKASEDTPLYCRQCGQILPRPWIHDKNGYRLMKGFTSAYRRMKWDSPCNTLTRNLSYACSDSKLHPEQNRVLSLYEAFLVHTITDFIYNWQRMDGKKLSDNVIRDIIGESIPPRGLYIIVQYILKIMTS